MNTVELFPSCEVFLDKLLIWVIITIRLLRLRFDENKFMHGKKFGAAAAFVVVVLPHHGFNATAAPLLRQR